MVTGRKELILEGLNCASCASKIEEQIKALAGVTEVSVNFATKKLSLETERVEELEQVIQEVRDIIRKLEPDVTVSEKKVDFTQKKAFLLMGLDCANCAAKIERQVQNISGVKSAMVNFPAKKLLVEVSSGSNNADILSHIQERIKRIEPDVEVRPAGEEKKVLAREEEKHGEKMETIRLAVGALLFAVAIVFTFSFTTEAVLYGISYLLVGGEVLLKSVRNISRGQVFDENFLMSIATLGAFAIRQFPEAVAVMLFYQVGELFQDYAVNRSRKSIAALMDIRPDFANLKVGNETKQVSPESVNIGDIIVVKPGEKVPLDGKVVEGTSMVDTSAMTGESVPREAVPGGDVLAGFINKSGVLSIEVTKKFAESTVSKILDLVENAAGKKAPTENFITKFARYYTPVVVFGALGIALLPPLFIPGATFSQWIYRALVVLVISCPCALVISIPLGFFGGIGGASRNGVLVKGGNYLEALNNVKIAVFDKTGTLTKGVFKVTSLVPAGDFSKDKLLEYASFAEVHSNHPIAKSIIEAYGQKVATEKIETYEEISGHGIKVKVGGEEILAGNIKLMKKEGVEYSQEQIVGTVVHLAVNKKYAGYIVISDEIKEDSPRAMQQLKELGVRKLVMLTGDNQAVGQAVGKSLGLDEVRAELLPDHKVEQVEKLNREKGPKESLMFVGDGINDAPVLARADIGVAMGGLGSDAAIEAADVVLMTDEPSKLATAIKIARRTRGIVWQNIIMAMLVKGIFLVLGAFGVATMWEAVFADVGVALVAILNAMRVMRFNPAEPLVAR
ncbi:heavy metal translocating P-type ATPase [Desulfotomaculum nigrificans]|uniref:heavy metal translocating P-type ATPase n=1 Tax=Desulfotomaculum nigrificans TaxID=1565 RepID=UPI0001FAE78A|nr:heavy metal translocating P-type ATPase [Desulfotomaculum nigrificans]MDA8210559.1 heavy metal translocating P-type ATPase [Clostridia bacterium]